MTWTNLWSRQLRDLQLSCPEMLQYLSHRPFSLLLFYFLFALPPLLSMSFYQEAKRKSHSTLLFFLSPSKQRAFLICAILHFFMHLCFICDQFDLPLSYNFCYKCNPLRFLLFVLRAFDENLIIFCWPLHALFYFPFFVMGLREKYIQLYSLRRSTDFLLQRDFVGVRVFCRYCYATFKRLF